jgi:hypothetical protein
MRTHDHDHDQATTAERPRDRAGRRDDSPELLAQRALAQGRAGLLDAGALAHLQRAAGNAGVGSLVSDQAPASPVLEVLGSGGGQRLDDGTRADMEASFGHDFGGVRVHAGPTASRSAEAVHAQAYTVGDDIVFRGGGYDPGSTSGKRLLAHELTHVVQQRSGPVDGTPTDEGISLSDPSDRFEQAAEEAADEVVES